ncbi:MAG: DUF3579 domain-containing protein [Burkholderiales bacterium]|nr:DUF3579 domain-containing protein [Burkholderiales bacterium]
MASLRRGEGDSKAGIRPRWRGCCGAAAAGRAGDNRFELTLHRVAEPRVVFIQGVTKEGKTFRPSDWAERLAGAMSCFRPDGSGSGRVIGYSPYCVPRDIGGVKGVLVNAEVRELEPMAWDFVMHFARDNNLVVIEDPRVT